MSTQEPWLDKKHWASNSISSDARRGHWGAWGFAMLWNLGSAPLLFQSEEIWEKTQREPITAIAFLFPLIGVFLVGLAVRATRQRQHFGLTPLVMDPFPGSLGGHVGGSIQTVIPFDPQYNFQVNLSCIHRRFVRSGKKRRRRESVVWHSDGVCHSEPGGGGSRLQFRFDVPENLPASQPHSRNYHLWRLRVRTELPGLDFDRGFEIPVYGTGEQQSGITLATEEHPATVDAAMSGVESVADITPVPGGIEVGFPAMQRPGQGIFLVLFGLVFGGVGVGVGMAGESWFLSAIFTLFGALFISMGGFYLGKSLLVAVTTNGIRSRRFLFGYPLTTRQLAVADIRKIKIKQGATMQSGNKTTVYYQLFAQNNQEKSFPVAERLTSRPEAELLRETYLTYLGVSPGQ